MIELNPVDRITAGAVGEPGQRVFYLQARQAQRLVTLLCEKQQVELLAASVIEILTRLDQPLEPNEEIADLELEEPIDPEWRAGRLALGFEEERGLFLLEVEELVPESDEDDENEDDAVEPGRARFWANRDQMLALASHGAAVAAAGRPRCELCGNPMEAEGHVCPALNGHRGEA